MQIGATSSLEHTMKLQDAHGHHGQVGHHVVLFQERPHGSEHFRCIAIGAVHHPIKGKLGFVSQCHVSSNASI